MTTENNINSKDWTIVCHKDYGDENSVSIVEQRNGEITVTHLGQSDPIGGDINSCPAFLGVNARGEAIIMDPATKAISNTHSVPADARFVYAYRDPESTRVWFVNDGDKDGNDTLLCDGQGSSIGIVAKKDDQALHMETLCIGRGHHMTAFTYPTLEAADIPVRAFSSNLLDGTISVIGNDPNDAVSFLKVIDTINLFDTRFDQGDAASLPNNAFPHGMEFSALTGKLYNLNNGYGSIAVIDPTTNQVESTIEMKVSSNLLLSRCGRYLIGKGADRKGNAEHVMGRLSVVDIVKEELVTCIDLPDIYPSVYRFNPAGDRLYVTTAATGKGVQAENLITDVVQVYDTSALPALKLVEEIQLETTTSGRRPIAILENHNGEAPVIFVPNPTHGSLSIIDGATNAVIETVEIGKGEMKEFSFSFWNDRTIYGA
ncbi:MAG TPA: hypothetical protein ENK35_00015 [Candidatus Tenderia sp.]|nr:hypothetical protein [Candidatus Tenderia sp.]